METTRAIILDVMECWPLELLVEVEGRKRSFVLDEEAQVFQGTETVPLNRLIPDVHVQLNSEDGKAIHQVRILD